MKGLQRICLLTKWLVMELARISNGGVRAQFQILYGWVSGKRGVEMTPKSSAYVAAFHEDI